MYKCQVKQKSRLGYGLGSLPERIAYWHPASFTLPGLSTKLSKSIISAAFVLANQYVPIPFYRTNRESAALITVRMGTRKQFDGAGGTLAEAEVVSLYEPDQRGIWFDPGDDWTTNRAEGLEIYALPVLCHEIGHTLGFGHGRTGLMAPYYDPLVTTPTKEEVAKLLKAYPEMR
jgi:hypothetical protein